MEKWIQFHASMLIKVFFGAGKTDKVMKPKTLFISLLTLFVSMTMNAQTILKGDMNDDEKVTIADVTSLVNVILGKAPQETINVGGSPYMVDNTSVVGTWYAPDGTSFTLNEDGTTDFGTGFTYKFRPYQGTLMIFNTSGAPVKTFVLNEVESSYLLAVNYATGTYTYYTNSGSLATGITLDQTSLEMNSGTTAQLTATLTPEDSFGNVTWSSMDESVATVDANGVVTAVAGGTCTITATTSGSLKTATCSITVKQMVHSITLSQTTAVLELDGYVRLTATVLPDNAANKNVVWSSSNEDVAPVRNGRVDAYGYGTAVVTCEAADGSGVKATCLIQIVDPNSYVDLGLPSGTLWATCNIGANSPEEYGGYYAWGETETKLSYGWSTYKWCKGSARTLTKYCCESTYGYNGYTDDLTELEMEDDAAYVNWGPAWRMPSKEQFAELRNSENTTWELTTLNGVSGWKYTSVRNGNSIFLPQGGGGLYTSSRDTGYYWTRTYRTTVYSNSNNNNCYAVIYLIYTENDQLGTGASSREKRANIRPVRQPD